MKKRYLTSVLGVALAAAAMAAAVNAPAEVLDNLAFFSDFELLSNLEILEDEADGGNELSVSTAPAVPEVPAVSSTTVAVSTSAVAVRISTETVKVSTFTRRSYEKR